MLSLSYLTRAVYLFGLSLALCVLLRPNPSQGQFRGLPHPAGVPPMIPMGLPPPHLMMALNNGMTDTTGAMMMMSRMSMMGGMGMMGMGGFAGKGMGGFSGKNAL